MSQDYDGLIAQVQEIEGELQRTAQDNRVLRHRLEIEQRRFVRQEHQLKLLRTFSASMFSMIDSAQLYALACESIVYQLVWDTALVVKMEEEAHILGFFQATASQLESVQKQLSLSTVFREANHHSHAFSTYHDSSPQALSLRTIFHTDELIGMPIPYPESDHAYLVVCSHSQRSRFHSEEDMDFLAAVAVQLGYAVQNTLSFIGLEDQNRKLRELDELKNSFISITSHQLRTPLSIIKWILSILQGDEAVAALEKQLKLIKQAYETNERLIRVVNNLLNVSRIQEGQLPHNPQPQDFLEMLRDLCDQAAKVATEHQLRFEQEIPDGQLFLPLDPILFKESLQNLLDNAIAYSDPGGYVRVQFFQDEQQLGVRITNTGPGITEVDRGHIFEQFYRSPEAIRLQPNGNGLGLYLSRTVLRAHKGDITCESHPGEETTFTVSLPQTIRNP